MLCGARSYVQCDRNHTVCDSFYRARVSRLLHIIIALFCTHQARAPLGIADRRVRPRSWSAKCADGGRATSPKDIELRGLRL